MFAGLLASAALVGSGTCVAQESGDRAGQALWRSCSTCHCVPDPRIPQDEDWLKLNETTTCISGENDTPEARKALIAYLRSKETIRPLLIDERHEPPAGKKYGRIRLPSTAGSAYLKAERESVRAGSPSKIRLHWKTSEKGTTLSLPAGEYRVVSYCFYRLDEQERRWCVSGSSAEGCAQLVLGGDKEAAFDFRPEIQAHLDCEADGDRHVFKFFMTNRGGQRMSISRDGKLVDPTWVVTGADGQRIDRGDFEVT